MLPLLPGPCRAVLIEMLTPVQKYGDIFVKRDDLFEVAGVRGGKARTCMYLAQGAKGLVTAGSRSSPQVNIVAHVAKHYGIPCRAHTPQGVLSAELQEAKACGVEIVQHRAGYNSVIVARAREDAAARGWVEIPFGMVCMEAVRQTAAQVVNLSGHGIKRIVVPVGSGMSLCGIYRGLIDNGLQIPILGVVVGASPQKRVARFIRSGLFSGPSLSFVESNVAYHDAVQVTWHSIKLDPIYEAKAVPYLAVGDLFWIVGCRNNLD
jgi:1-aminocyclopropane-1-carboxylate deaminase/D-cysteine desulfhydrase-like pyridoxal-dependent ACC family enzyme